MYSLKRHPSLVTGLIVAMIAGIFLLDLLEPLAVYDWALYFIPLFFTFWSKGRHYSILVAASCTILIYLAFVLSPLVVSFTATINRSLGVVVLWIMALILLQRRLGEEEREKLVGELKDALAKIRVLRGLLRICSHCKKIRDDKDQWHSVEAYVTKHTEADFAHEICPECLHKHYPEPT